MSQTTFNYNKFKELVEIFAEKRYDNNVLNILNILNTICNATEERQKEAQTVAGEVDTMLVVGGRHSSNTQKLEAENFIPLQNQKICIVSQTTFNYNKFKELVEIFAEKRYDNNVLNILNILNTICNATEERQKEAQTVAGEVDTMLVVGGRHSSNTQKLFEICKKECGNTYYIQSPVDLDSEMFQNSRYVGITAGASTPKKIIEEVQEHVRVKF